MVQRAFKDVPEGKVDDADQHSLLGSLGWSRGTSWEDLLRSKRILIVSEAGAGKTYECRSQAQRLWNLGEPAFFVELATLAAGDLRSLLNHNEESRLDAWLSSQSDIGTFFLDSIDELKLTQASFEQALKRFSKCVGGHLGRARVIITTRPIPFDEQLIRTHLPVPDASRDAPKEEIFAKIAMSEHEHQGGKDDNTAAEWRTVALMPLSDAQIVEFAMKQGVDDADALLDDLRKRNAQEFARRPQDLVELCSDWREHKRIRTHFDQVAANVQIKLQPRDDRPEPAELSVEKAISGASRLALAMLVTRRLTIRHSTASDSIEGAAALDPAKVLSDWPPGERKALLERPLFGFASYGRVRFHHRSVAEYLAAERLKTLQGRGMTFRALKRLLFAQTKGRTIVRPSKRPVAGWLALSNPGIFEMLRDNEPAVLFDEGDPESLSQSQRNQALSAYVERYGTGGWRGLRVPDIQIHRFASEGLADQIGRLWGEGIENPDVRQILLNLIEIGRIKDCAHIPRALAFHEKTDPVERVIALDALVALKDPVLKDVAYSVAGGDDRWPEEITFGAILRLFPHDLTVEQLFHALRRLKRTKRRADDMNWQLPRLIENAELDYPKLKALRDGLVQLISDGLKWSEEWPHIVSDRWHLSGALAAVCKRGLVVSRGSDWLHACVLALRLRHRDNGDSDPHKAVREHLAGLSPEENACLFWASDNFVQSVRAISDPLARLAEVRWHGSPVELRAERDLGWIKEALGNTACTVADRTMMLHAAMRLPPNGEDWRDHVSALRNLVADQPGLLTVIDDWLKPSKQQKVLERWERKDAERKKQLERRKAKDRASWIQFWREVAARPETVFSPDRTWNTVWNLWRTMSNDGEAGRASGWNRRFIEEQFGRETADRMRRSLMRIWREDRPTLGSERPEGERNTYLVRWQLGLAAIYAEAEDPDWAAKLTEEEASLAARYAFIELNGLPLWVEKLVAAHPAAVEVTLGTELTWELADDQSQEGHSMLLQSIGSAPECVARLFLPRLQAWLEANLDAPANGSRRAEHLRRVISLMLKRGDETLRDRLLFVARKRLENDSEDRFSSVWLPALIRMDPVSGIAALEDRLRTIEPSPLSAGVIWFSFLFGDRGDAIDLKDPAFEPDLLLHLLRLAYQHVRPEDDVEHESTYTPDTRDHAERARHVILNALMDAKGEAAWLAKLKLAADPLCAHFKDRILAIAEENWAQEIDSETYDEAQAVALDKFGEAPASTNQAMFSILKDRLLDLDDLLLRDDSPREGWAKFSDEKLMRREISRELRHAANGLYKIDQEAVTADEKETDIRLRSMASDCEAVIELKVADGRTAKDLRDTIMNQLVTKYLAAENARSGCLLFTLAKNRKWEHPDTGKRIGLDELMLLLHQEAKRVEEAMGGTVALTVHVLDLRPRLPVEGKT